MDHPETDRMLANELKGILKDLRDKNKKLTDEKKAAQNTSTFAWVMLALLVVAVLVAMSGGSGHHHYRY